MSDRMTSIHLPGAGLRNGWSEWGRKTPAEMIAILRQRAQADLDVAKRLLEAPDEAFHVATYVGLYVRRHYEVLQDGTSVKSETHP